ncbi:hypothetical protein V8G54_019382 [Vigna mungo]|uniref:Uncharacterized protein n=1 Tax=Vigna mungo TaxID=3915 RepID=A0AAQ3NBU9_VIGMU
MGLLMNHSRRTSLTMPKRGATIWWSLGLFTLFHLTYGTIFFGWTVLRPYGMTSNPDFFREIFYGFPHCKMKQLACVKEIALSRNSSLSFESYGMNLRIFVQNQFAPVKYHIIAQRKHEDRVLQFLRGLNEQYVGHTIEVCYKKHRFPSVIDFTVEKAS